MSETSDKIKIMQAFEDGETVEVQLNREGHWGRVIYTNWDWASNNYRIKQKPREFLMSANPNGWIVTPIKCSVKAFETIKVMEILD